MNVCICKTYPIVHFKYMQFIICQCTPTKQFKYSIRLWLVYAVLCLISQSFLTLCDSMDCSPPGSSVPGIFQARILAWVAISSPRGSSWPRNQTRISHLLHCRKILYPLSYQGSPNNIEVIIDFIYRHCNFTKVTYYSNACYCYYYCCCCH